MTDCAATCSFTGLTLSWSGADRNLLLGLVVMLLFAFNNECMRLAYDRAAESQALRTNK